MLLTRDADGEQHGNGHLEMRPLGGVVSRPNGAGTLTSGEKRATDDENHKFLNIVIDQVVVVFHVVIHGGFPFGFDRSCCCC